MMKKKVLYFIGSALLIFAVLIVSCTSYYGGKKNIGIQLYSLRDDISEYGIVSVLKQLAEIGYVNLESASYDNNKIYGFAPEEFKKLCASLNLKLISAHVGHGMSGDEVSDMEWWDKAIEDHVKAGASYLVIPGLHVSENPSLEEITKLTDYMNSIGKKAKTAGLKFGYHNHSFEFNTKVGNKSVYDLFIDKTNPEYVSFEMDTYWVVKSGNDPVEYLNRYPNRFFLLHIKDETAVGQENVVDFRSVFKSAYAAGVKDWFVEIERYKGTPMEEAKKSIDYLNMSDFVK